MSYQVELLFELRSYTEFMECSDVMDASAPKLTVLCQACS